MAQEDIHDGEFTEDWTFEPSASRELAVTDPDERFATQHGWRFFEVTRWVPNAALTGLIEAQQGRRLRVAVLSIDAQGSLHETYLVGTDNPDSISTRNEVRDLLAPRRTELVYVPPARLVSVLEAAYAAEAPDEDGAVVRETSAAGTFFEYAIDEGLRREASDLHLLATRNNGLSYCYTVAGFFENPIPLDPTIARRLVNFIRNRANMPTDGRNLPQSAEIEWTSHAGSVHLRIETVPSQHGISATIRIQPVRWRDLDHLGLPPYARDLVDQITRLSGGLILTTAPTSQGKTSTQLAILEKIIRDGGRKVVTNEDPIERDLGDAATQIQVNSEIGLTPAVAGKSLLRLAPKVIMVGELRDESTADEAIQAAHTGHTVFGTLHTERALGVIPRLTRLGVHRADIAESLAAVIAQRLLQRLCPTCKVYDGKVALPRPDGCSECDYSGWKGLVPAYEVLPVSTELADAIEVGKPMSELRKIVASEGIPSLRYAILELVARGETTQEVASRAIRARLAINPELVGDVHE